MNEEITNEVQESKYSIRVTIPQRANGTFSIETSVTVKGDDLAQMQKDLELANAMAWQSGTAEVAYRESQQQ